MGFLSRLKIRSWMDLYMVMTALVVPWQSVQVITKGVSMYTVINLLVVGLLLIGPNLRGGRIRFLFVAPLLVYMYGTLLGMINSEALLRNLYTIGQDVYLYVWFCLLVLILSQRREASGKLAAWWMVSAVLVFTLSLALGLGIEGGGRIEFTFRNPNRAAAYWVMTFFLALHPDIPRWVRVVIWPMAVVGVALTGSNSGLLGLVVGVSVYWLGRAYAETHGKPSVVRVVMLTSLIVGALVIGERVGADDALETVGRVASQGATGENRIDRSSSARFEIWRIGLETFKKHPFGIGPGSFVAQVETGLHGDHGVEIHSDFVATLVERGVVGMLGFLLFLGAIAAAALRSLRLASEIDDKQAMSWSSALAAMTAAYLSFSSAHEVLHHDTLWLTLALLSMNLIIVENWAAWASRRRAAAAPRRALPQMVA